MVTVVLLLLVIYVLVGMFLGFREATKLAIVSAFITILVPLLVKVFV